MHGNLRRVLLKYLLRPSGAGEVDAEDAALGLRHVRMERVPCVPSSTVDAAAFVSFGFEEAEDREGLIRAGHVEYTIVASGWGFAPYLQDKDGNPTGTPLPVDEILGDLGSDLTDGSLFSPEDMEHLARELETERKLHDALRNRVRKVMEILGAMELESLEQVAERAVRERQLMEDACRVLSEDMGPAHALGCYMHGRVRVLIFPSDESRRWWAKQIAESPLSIFVAAPKDAPKSECEAAVRAALRWHGAH